MIDTWIRRSGYADVTATLAKNYPFMVPLAREINPLDHCPWLIEHIADRPKFVLFHTEDRYLAPTTILTTKWQISLALTVSSPEVQHKVFFKDEKDAILFKITCG